MFIWNATHYPICNLGGRGDMKNKIACVLVVTLLMSLSAIVIIPNEFRVEATPIGDEDGGSIGLDYDFLWNVTEKIANVVHDYPTGMIPKGRAFGTWGDRYTADYILVSEMNNIGLENVRKLQIGHIPNSKREDYSTKVEVNDYSLSIYHSDPLCQYPYQNPVPWSEVFPLQAHIQIGYLEASPITIRLLMLVYIV